MNSSISFGLFLLALAIYFEIRNKGKDKNKEIKPSERRDDGARIYSPAFRHLPQNIHHRRFQPPPHKRK